MKKPKKAPQPHSSLNPEVDAYISAAPSFSRSMLIKVRALFHQASPDIKESIKWYTPHFEYEGNIAYLGTFERKYVSLGFYYGHFIKDKHGFLCVNENRPYIASMKWENISELPSDKILIEYIREAIALNAK